MLVKYMSKIIGLNDIPKIDIISLNCILIIKTMSEKIMERKIFTFLL